jgi:hypothetical protein
MTTFPPYADAPTAETVPELKVERTGRSAAPWVWKIYLGGAVVTQPSQGQRSPEDALMLGQEALRKFRTR